MPTHKGDVSGIMILELETSLTYIYISRVGFSVQPTRIVDPISIFKEGSKNMNSCANQ